jgi:hypothetical protein
VPTEREINKSSKLRPLENPCEMLQLIEGGSRKKTRQS